MANADAVKRPILLVLAGLLLPVPIAGWVLAQTLTERISEFSGFTTAYVHTLATSAFAVILFASALTNAIIVSLRSRDRPRSYRWGGYPLWQMAVLVLSVGWLACIVVGEAAVAVERLLAVAIAAGSIGAFVLAVKPDPQAKANKDARLGARSPVTSRRISLLKVVVPFAVAFAGLVYVIVAQNLVVEHRDCSPTGKGQFNQTNYLYTSCGDFTVDTSRVGRDELDDRLYAGRPLDIVTQGYWLEFPILPLAISMAPSR